MAEFEVQLVVVAAIGIEIETGAENEAVVKATTTTDRGVQIVDGLCG